MAEGLGAASSKLCPRAGYAKLYTKFGQELVVRTNCNTWRCLSCRDRVKNLVLMRIEYGCSILNPSWFITLTFRKTKGVPSRDAQYVARRWARFWYLYLKSHKSQPPWFRVIELTKQKQPHLHLVTGGLDLTTKESIRDEWATLWAQTVQDVRDDVFKATWVWPVLSAAKAAGYMAKYLLKNLQHREELEAKGFIRRWSRSRNWPSGPLALKGTEDGWAHTKWEWKGGAFADQNALKADNSEGHPLLEHIGTDLAVELSARKAGQRASKQLESLMRRLQSVN